MIQLLIQRLLSLVLFGVISASAAGQWTPAGDEDRHREVLDILKTAESHTKFFETEKTFIKVKTPAYHEARWTLFRYHRFEDPTRSAEDPKQIKRFINYCKKEELVEEEDVWFFQNAAISACKELIVDHPGFEVEVDGVRLIEGIEYANIDGYPLRLDLYLPDEPRIKPAPCVIFIHGGGWRQHKRTWMANHAAVIAREGYAACSIDYRLWPAVGIHQCVKDVKAAVRWVRANAEEYGIDGDKIGASGGSAGAHLSAVLATMADVPEFDGSGGNQDVSSRIQAAVLFAVPSFTGKRDRVRKKTEHKDSRRDSELRRKVSPYWFATKDDAPLLFMHGTEDATVPIDEARDMYAKYQELGIQTELVELEGKPHVFYMTEETAMRAFKFFRKIFEE